MLLNPLWKDVDLNSLLSGTTPAIHRTHTSNMASEPFTLRWGILGNSMKLALYQLSTDQIIQPLEA